MNQQKSQMGMEIRVPQANKDAGEDVTEATVLSWKKNDGDSVEEGEVLCELEFGKAIVEVEAASAGCLKIVVDAGQMVAAGCVIGYIRDAQ